MLALVVKNDFSDTEPIQSNSLKLSIEDAKGYFLNTYGVTAQILELPKNVIERVDFTKAAKEAKGALSFDEYFGMAAVEIVDTKQIIIKR